MKTTAELQAELEALQAELAELKTAIPAAKARLKELERRQSDLLPGYRSLGEIGKKQREVRNNAFPIYGNTYGTVRIIAVDTKWITVRHDWCEDADVTQYSRETGRKKGSRSERGGIDVAKALAIWEEHLRATKPEPMEEVGMWKRN